MKQTHVIPSSALAVALCCLAPFSLAAEDSPSAEPAQADSAEDAVEEDRAGKPQPFRPGDAVPSLEDITMIQGELPASLAEPGSLYLIECWATWCGPCVAQIPHLNALHQKFADKGLRVLGMNVFEDGLEKATEFVKKKGEAMSYPVGFSGGKKSTFAATWMLPNGYRAIPHAFLVKDGKLLFCSHPASIDDEMIEGLLAGTYDTAGMVEKQLESEEYRRVRQEMEQMARADNWAGVEVACRRLMDEKNYSVGTTYIISLIRQSKFNALQEMMKKEEHPVIGARHVVNSIAMYAEPGTEGLAEIAPKMIAYLESTGMPDAPIYRKGSEHMTYARFLYLAGQQEKSKAHLATFLEKLNNTPEDSPDYDERMIKYFSGFIERAQARVAEGEFPALHHVRR